MSRMSRSGAGAGGRIGARIAVGVAGLALGGVTAAAPVAAHAAAAATRSGTGTAAGAVSRTAPGTVSTAVASLCPDNTICLFYGRDFTGPQIRLSPTDPLHLYYPDLHQLSCVLPTGAACVSTTFPDYSNGHWSDQVTSFVNNVRSLYCWFSGENYSGHGYTMNMYSTMSALPAYNNDTMRSIRPC
jgi:hypothetical protein